MGSRPGDSARAVKARSVNSPHKPRRMPGRPKYSKLRTTKETSHEQVSEPKPLTNRLGIRDVACKSRSLLFAQLVCRQHMSHHTEAISIVSG